MPWGIGAFIGAAAQLADQGRRYRFETGPGYTVSEDRIRQEATKSQEGWEAFKRWHNEQAIRRREERRQKLINLRDVRMSTRLERRREAIRLKWYSRGIVLGTFTFSVPVALGIIALGWRFAVWAMAS